MTARFVSPGPKRLCPPIVKRFSHLLSASRGRRLSVPRIFFFPRPTPDRLPDCPVQTKGEETSFVYSTRSLARSRSFGGCADYWPGYLSIIKTIRSYRLSRPGAVVFSALSINVLIDFGPLPGGRDPPLPARSLVCPFAFDLLYRALLSSPPLYLRHRSFYLSFKPPAPASFPMVPRYLLKVTH